MKKENVFLKLERSNAHLLNKFQLHKTLQLTKPTIILKVLQAKHATVEKNCQKLKSIGIANQRNISAKDTI